MSIASTNDPDPPDGEAERQADAMKDQLRKDVASWSAERSGALARQVAELGSPVANQPAPRRAKRAKRERLASPEVKSTSATKKPFGMSYDGVTEADYVSYMIARGAR